MSHPQRPAVPAASRETEIGRVLAGCWGRDTWEIGDPEFRTLRGYTEHSRHSIQFVALPSGIRKEMKFFLARRLCDGIVSLATTVGYGRTLENLASFLRERYPGARSIIEIDVRKSLLAYRSFLTARAVKDVTYHVRVMRQFWLFMSEFYDTRPEFDKDVWDFRRIRGTRYPKTDSKYRLSFTGIPAEFRDLTKRFIRAHLATRSFAFCQFYVLKLACFFEFIRRIEPSWKDLKPLSRDHIERFLARLASEPWKGRIPSVRYRCDMWLVLRGFLEYIQCAGYPEAPIAPVAMLVRREDRPHLPQRSDSSIRFIPQEVLAQLEEHLCHLTPKHCIPVVVLLRATGWRISDILNLKLDTCLVRKPTGWWIRGDISKSAVLGHEVPISDEVAAVVQAAKELAEKHSTPENNPQRYLFVRLTGARKGLPYHVRSVESVLNRFARKFNIVDAEGKPFHFRNHAFRHTKGVELINNGMSILHVQKWMAHASPTMTLTYARILDTTLRSEWERAFANGAVQITPTGTTRRVSLQDMLDENEIEWEWIRHNLDAVRLPNGYCFKSHRATCHAQLVPCYTCRSFCTTVAFLPQLEREASETQEIIARGKAQGMLHWVSKNEQKLEVLTRVIETLKAGRTHHPAGKAGREYVGEERHHVR